MELRSITTHKFMRSPALLAVGALGLLAVAFAPQPGADPPPTTRTYVGTQACVSCHSEKFSAGSDYRGIDAFRQTMHQNIQQRPTPQTVVIDKYFRGDSVLKAYLSRVQVPGKDTLLIHLFMSPDKKDYLMQMKISGGTDETPVMKVSYVHGGSGWKQRYLVNIDGSFYVGPFQFVLPGYRNRTAEHGEFYYLDVNRWVTIENGEAHFVKWTSNEFRAQSWDRTCAPCHTTGPSINTVVTGKDTSYRGNWVGVAQKDSAVIDQNIMIGCENCHGPGSEHVATLGKAGTIINPTSWGNSLEGTKMKLDLCGSCHTRTKSISGQLGFPYDEVQNTFYRPGEPLSDFINDKFAGMATWPDGKTSYAHHQAGQDYQESAHYAKDVFKNGCYDCHTVHYSNPDLPAQLNQNWFSMNAGEGCIKCHAEKIEATKVADKLINTHTHHPQSMSQCVNCHMTRTSSIGFLDLPGNQYWEFTKRLYDFSNHSFKVIPPSNTLNYAQTGIGIGMINTCAESCHRNGRGSRNSSAQMPAAPTWNISDNQYGIWNQPTDLALADTLNRYYEQWWKTSSVYVGTTETRTSLVSVSPNPMSMSTTIQFRIAPGDAAVLEVFDARGSRVFTLDQSEAGDQSYEWQGTDMTGRRLPGGTYFVRIKSSRGVSEKRLVIER